MSFADRYGPWALITGAGNGLGAEFGRQLAARGLKVLLIDIDTAGLSRVSAEIQARGGEARTLTLDLCQPNFIGAVQAAIAHLDIGLLVNNAGITTIGLFVDRPIEQHLKVVDLNVRAPLLLSHALAPQLIKRGRGGILFTCSMSGMQGTAYVASYAATKAHNLILAEGLWQELQTHGVDVTGCMLGTTNTPGFVNSQPDLQRAGNVPVMEIGEAVTESLNALGRGPRAVAGRLNRVIHFFLQHFVPHARLVSLVSRSTTALYGPR